MMMNKQKGITLIGAIFVVVIVSLLGIYLVKITGAQRQTVVMNLQSARAYQAANAGIEWGITRLLNGSYCEASRELTETINGFTVTVQCSQLQDSGNDYDEAGETINIFKLSATSVYGSYGQTNFTSRTIETLLHGN